MHSCVKSSAPCAKRGQQGSIFIFAITALAVLLLVSAVSVELALQSLDRAAKQRNSQIAFELAEAGIDAGEAWLRDQGIPPTGVAIFDPFGGPQTLTTGSYTVLIIPHPDNPGAWRKRYAIQSTGAAVLSGATSQVVAQLQEQSFALYSYFTDQEKSSVSGGTIWFYARDRIYGPAHSNDQFHVSWSQTAAEPIFYGTVSSAAATVAWSPSAPTTPQQWQRVLQGGQDALTLGVDRIDLPEMSSLQRNAAWGSDTGFPSTDGVYVPLVGSTMDAGIYVRGNCQVTFSLEAGTGNQVVTITQSSATTTITVDPAANETTVTDGTPTGTNTYVGCPNGVIYCTGNITSLKGTLADNYQNGMSIITRNAWTIATDLAAGKDITLTNSLAYHTLPDPEQSETDPSNLRAATLGLLADDIVVASNCPNEMTIDGVILANGSFYYAAWNTIKRANLHILGGVIQRRRGPVGTFSGTTLVTGYSKDYQYDIRMPDSPPPYFPTTGQYDLLSWQFK